MIKKRQFDNAYHKEYVGAPIGYIIDDKKKNIVEGYIEWDDPYKWISFSGILDFLRNFKLTK